MKCVRVPTVSHQFLAANSSKTAQKTDCPLGGDTMTTKNTKTWVHYYYNATDAACIVDILSGVHFFIVKRHAGRIANVDFGAANGMLERGENL